MARIVLDNVSVEFPIMNANNQSIRRALLRGSVGGGLARRSRRTATIKALHEVSLHLKDGDRLGLIGHNGAGKSTLLRLMAGIYEPSSGYLRCEGRIVPLFDITIGFDHEANGLENIMLRGLYLGMDKATIRARTPQIAEFAGLGDYLFLPLRTYSTGMVLRLAFAVAVEAEPDIILMDEWIGTGDHRFTDRAKVRLDELITRSRILVVASHSEQIIRATCNKALLLGHGCPLCLGEVDEVYRYYEFFGSDIFFNAEQYVAKYADIAQAVDESIIAPWAHFLRWGVFEGRSPGNGVDLAAFRLDRTFVEAVERGDGLAAANRIGAVAPFLASFTPPASWTPPRSMAYPADFVVADGHRVLTPLEFRARFPDVEVQTPPTGFVPLGGLRAG